MIHWYQIPQLFIEQTIDCFIEWIAPYIEIDSIYKSLLDYLKSI